MRPGVSGPTFEGVFQVRHQPYQLVTPKSPLVSEANSAPPSHHGELSPATVRPMDPIDAITLLTLLTELLKLALDLSERPGGDHSPDDDHSLP